LFEPDSVPAERIFHRIDPFFFMSMFGSPVVSFTPIEPSKVGSVGIVPAGPCGPVKPEMAGSGITEKPIRPSPPLR
jgi:hypothetical protein